jgi:polysaccharide pyruvyl transferase WcaK-like protein
MTMVWIAKILGKKAMVYGAGVEEIAFRPTRFCVRHVFNRADLIVLRDEDSKVRLVGSFGVDRARVVATADPVLALRVPSQEEMWRKARAFGVTVEGPPVVVINFAYGIDRREILLDFFAALADHVVKEFGARVLFVPMNMAETKDRAGMERALSRMRFAKNADILKPPYAHPEVISIVEGAELVISSRMHLLIFAALVGTPILGISRMPKVDAFLDHYGLRAGASTKDLDFERFRPILDQTWTSRMQIREALMTKRHTLRDRAQSTAKLFHDLAEATS